MGYRPFTGTQDILSKHPEYAHFTASRTVTLPSGETVVDRIVLAATGELEVSTCTALVHPDDLLVADPNRYYADLGFDRPTRGITKRQLREHYRDLGGPGNARLTYCFKQLLNPEIRAAYDARPPGKVMFDRYVNDKLRKQASDWASAKAAETGEVVDAGEFLTKVLKVPTDAEVEKKALSESHDSFHTDSGWGFGYYLWKSRKFDDSTLRIWQEMLVRECARQGLSVRFAVGYCGHTESKWIKQSHTDWGMWKETTITIVFLNENVLPLRELAEAAAASFLPQQVTPNSEGAP